MKNTTDTTLQASAYLYPILGVLLIWLVYWIQQKMGWNFNDYGIQPRSLKGLRGILFSPFLHSGIKHLLSNSLPLLVLSVTLFYFYKRIAFEVLIFGAILTGLLTWLIGRGYSNHIGASGVVYLLASFLFFKGIWSKNIRMIAVSLIVVFLYGSLVWGMFPNKPNISWEGHLSGFISGVVFALVYRNYQTEIGSREPEKPKVISARDAEFLSHFDEDGNFVPTSEWERRRKEDQTDNTLDIEVDYSYRSGEKKEE